MEVRNLLEREPVVLLQHDGRTLLFGQQRHRLLRTARQILARHEVFDRFGRFGRSGQLHQIGTVRRLHGRCSALPTCPIAAQIQRDAIQPGRELGLASELRQSAKGPEKRLLADVARILFPTDRAVSQGINRPLPSKDELIEAVLVATHRAGDKLFVGRRHALRMGPLC